MLWLGAKIQTLFVLKSQISLPCPQNWAIIPHWQWKLETLEKRQILEGVISEGTYSFLH